MLRLRRSLILAALALIATITAVAASAAVVKGTSQANVTLTQTVSTGVVTPQTIPANFATTTQYANGTGAGQVDLIYAKQLSLVASTPQTLDLTSLTDLAGGSVAFARLREVIIQVVDTTAGHNLTAGDAASNAWSAVWGATGTHVIFAGSYLHLSDPSTVGGTNGMIVDSTHKSLKLDPGSNNLTVNIILVGCSAAS